MRVQSSAATRSAISFGSGFRACAERLMAILHTHDMARPPPATTRFQSLAAFIPAMRPNTVAVSRPLPDRYPDALEPDTPTAAPPAANRFGNGRPFIPSTRAWLSIAAPPWVWNSAPVTLMAQYGACSFLSN